MIVLVHHTKQSTKKPVKQSQGQDKQVFFKYFTRIGYWNKFGKYNDLNDLKDYFFLFKFYININHDEIDKLQNLNFRITPCFLYIT